LDAQTAKAGWATKLEKERDTIAHVQAAADEATAVFTVGPIPQMIFDLLSFLFFFLAMDSQGGRILPRGRIPEPKET